MKVLSLHIHHKRPGIRVFFIYVVATIIAVFWLSPFSKAAEKDFPFYPGEKLTFKLRWEFVPAGEATLEVLPMVTVNGLRSYHFVMTAQTTPFIDNFYKVRDRVDAYADEKMTHSVFYKKNQHEGKTRRDVAVYFDWERMEAQYLNFGKKRAPVSILPGSFDPFSILYYVRLLEIKEDLIYKRPVTDGKKCVMGIGTVIKRETIKLKSGTYDTYLLEPELKHIGGVFEKSKNAKLKIWITADQRRIPVKVKSKVVVGSFIAELVSYSATGEE
jgi:hypothetical protein